MSPVDTRESRTLEMVPLVVDALRNLCEVLARLADTLDEVRRICSSLEERFR